MSSQSYGTNQVYLGSRSHGGYDFDGRVRQCTIRGRLRLEPAHPEGRTYTLISLDPPMKVSADSTEVDQALLLNSSELPISSVWQEYPVPVHVFRALTPVDITASSLSQELVRFFEGGVIAPLPELLPLPPPRHFYEMLGLLYSVYVREGRSQIASDLRENGQPVGRWISELKSRHKTSASYPSKVDDVPDWCRRLLETFPDWTWE